MKIVICGSISKLFEMIKTKVKLEEDGHQVEIPDGAKEEFSQKRFQLESGEKAKEKIERDLIRGYFRKIKKCDAILVANFEKNGIKNYIGDNAFLEMGFAHVLNKKIFLLHSVPQMIYTEEIFAMEPVCLKGNLKLIP